MDEQRPTPSTGALRFLPAIISQRISTTLHAGVTVEENPIFSSALRSRHLMASQRNQRWQPSHRGGEGDRGQAHSLRRFEGAARLRPIDLEEALVADERLAAAAEEGSGTTNTPRQLRSLPNSAPHFGASDREWHEQPASLQQNNTRETESEGDTLNAVGDDVAFLNTATSINAEVDEVLSRRRLESQFSAFGVASMKSHVLTFLTTITCLPSEAQSTFLAVRNKIHSFAPRARVYGFAEVELAKQEQDAFSGIIQVVPMCTMRQVSHKRLLPIPWVQQNIVDRAWYLYFLIVFNVSVAGMYIVLGRLDPNRVLLAVSWAVSGLQLCFGCLWMLHLSKPICKLLVLTYDFWLMMFWLIISTITRAQHSQYRDDKQQFLFSNDVSYTFVQLCIMVMDAFPSVSRHNKGVVFVCNALLHAYTYCNWWFEVYTHSSISLENLDVLGTTFPLALLAQTAAAALFAFYVRLIFRTFFKKLDLAIVDFSVNVVPNQRFEDDAYQGSGSHLSTMDDFALAASPKYAEPSNSLRNFDSIQQNPDALRRATRGSRSSHSRPMLRDSATNPGGKDEVVSPSSYVTLHVDGSLPCAEDGVEHILDQLDAAVAPEGWIDTHLMEESCVFSSDRRTFLPNVFMLSYSPRPLIPWIAVYRMMSKWWFPYIFLIQGAATSCILAFWLNDNLDRSTLWVQMLVRMISLAHLLMYFFFGISLALARDALRTLDFWFVLVSFGMQLTASSYLYSQSDIPEVAYAHGALIGFLGLFFALLDCISATSFTPVMKGICGVGMVLYSIHDLFFSKTENQFASYNDSRIDLRFTVISAASLEQLSSLSLMILFSKIAARTLWMKSSLVYFQFGCIEEIQGEDGFINIFTTVRK